MWLVSDLSVLAVCKRSRKEARFFHHLGFLVSQVSLHYLVALIPCSLPPQDYYFVSVSFLIYMNRICRNWIWLLLFSLRCLEAACGCSPATPDLGLWLGFHNYELRLILGQLSLLAQLLALSARRRTEVQNRVSTWPSASHQIPRDLVIPRLLSENAAAFVLSSFPAIFCRESPFIRNTTTKP